MKTPPIDEVLRHLRAARRRLTAQYFLQVLLKALLIAGAGLVIFGAVNRWLLDRPPVDLPIAGFAVAGAVGVALLLALARRRRLSDVAEVLDRLGGTRDRFLTALDFTAGQEPTPMQALSVQECVKFVQGGKFSDLVRIRLPRGTWAVLVPVVALALLHWEAQQASAAREAQITAARAEVEDTAKKLEELAKRTAKASEQAKDEDLKKLAEHLQQRAEDLRAKATDPSEAGKSALREISALEQMIQEMQKKKAESLSPEEMKALADALKEKDATKEAGEALAKGDLKKAAEEMQKAAEQMAQQGDEKTPEEIKKALDQALKNLAEQKQLSEAMQKLQQEMQRSMSGKGGESGELAKQLAEMLRKMAQGKTGQGQPQQGGQQTPATLEQLLAALQNMKFGEGQPQEGQQPGPGNQGVKMQSFGKDQNKAGETAKAEQLTGKQGQGESLQQSLLSAGDSSKSRRGYKELYEAMAPAAQDAVVQENIPLGSRFFIKRYFESIRPQE